MSFDRDRISTGGWQGRILSSLLKAADDPSDELISPAEREALEEWAADLVASGELKDLELSEEAATIVAGLLPDQSLTADLLNRIECERRLARRRSLEMTEAAAVCPSSTPGALLKSLRTSQRLSLEEVSQSLEIPPHQLGAIESGEIPWFRIGADQLAIFASLVLIPLPRFAAYLRTTAKRSLSSQLEQRIGLALGRFDATQAEGLARRDTLKLAFSCVEEENVEGSNVLRRMEDLAEKAGGA